MGIAYYVVPEREVPGLDCFANGKALGRHPMDRVASQIGVRPLTEFFSISPEEAAEVFEGNPAPLPDGGFPPEQWFTADEGLVSVRGLLAHLEANPDSFRRAQAALKEDLREFEAILSRLAAEGVRWHLAIDY